MDAIHRLARPLLTPHGRFDGPDFTNASREKDDANDAQKQAVTGPLYRSNPAQAEADENADDAFSPGFEKSEQ